MYEQLYLQKGLPAHFGKNDYTTQWVILPTPLLRKPVAATHEKHMTLC